MKRSIFILLAASALAALSCTKEVNDQTAPEKEQVTMSFNATVGAPTKVELGAATAEGYGVMWSVGDAITVAAHDASVEDNSYTTGSEFTTDITQATASAVFEGTVDAGDAYYAVYPYNSNTRWYHQHKDFSVPFKAIQTANGLKNGILVAKAENGDLDFKHVTGFVKFTIPDTYMDIKEVRFSGNNSEVLASQYFYVYPEDLSKNKAAGSTYTELTLVPSSGEVFTPGTYYFTSLPASLTKGITLTFINSEGGEAVKSTDENKPAVIKAGDILNLGTISNLEFESEEPPVADGTYVVLAKHNDVYYAMGSTHNDNSSRLDETEFDYSANETHIKSLIWTFTNVSGAKYNVTNDAKYLVASSTNNANVNASSDVPLNVVDNEDGTYCITVVVSGTTRYLSRNDTNNGFAFYGNTGQNEILYLKAISYVEKPELETPVIVVEGNNANKTITVTWTDVENATSYEVACGNQSETVNTGVQTHTFTMAEYGTYDVTVTAKADGYVSAKSEVSSVVLKNPTDNTVSLIFPDDNRNNNKVGSYTATWTAKSGGYEWSISNFNNNNWGWTSIKCGRKDDPSVASISTKNLTDKAISQIVVTYGTLSKPDKINSATLEVSSFADFSQIIQTTNITVTTGEQTYSVSNPSSGRYYRLKFDMPATGKNGCFEITGIKYIAE